MASLGHPCKFQRVLRLGSVSARQSSSGRQSNFVALNRGRHLYLAGRPSRWALAHISGFVIVVIAFENSDGTVVQTARVTVLVDQWKGVQLHESQRITCGLIRSVTAAAISAAIVVVV